MRAVNLLPPEAATSRVSNVGVAPVVGAAAGIAALGIVVFLSHSAGSSVASEQRQVDSLKTQLAQVQAANTAPSSAASILGSRDARYTAVSQVMAQRLPWDDVLRDIGRVLPADTWFDSMTLTGPTPVSAATSTTPPAPSTSASAGTPGATITGYTRSPESLARVLQRLSLVPAFADVELMTSQRTVLNNKSVFQFTVSATLATPGATP